VQLGLGATENDGLPNEVAACCSFYSGQNVAGRRGRVYIGPLRPGALDLTSSGDSRLGFPFTSALATAASQVKLSNTVQAVWAVKSVSRKDLSITADDPVYRRVTAGWIDNAVDIQRRRGLTANFRSLWS
jgi:hypothetical protein